MNRNHWKYFRYFHVKQLDWPFSEIKWWSTVRFWGVLDQKVGTYY